MKPAGVAAVCFKPLSAGEFARAEQEIDELLGVTAQSTGAKVRRRRRLLRLPVARRPRSGFR